MAVASTGAHAVLSNFSALYIGGDALTARDADGNWYVASDGPMADSFFTMGGSMNKQLLNFQYAYLYNGFSLPLNGATQSNIDAFIFYGALGSNETRSTGISILSANGDTATVDMRGWVVEWNGHSIPMGTGAWSPGYANGVVPTIQTIPESSTYGMMLVGLGLVGAMAQHRKQAEA